MPIIQDTIVVCANTQLREAAIVLSCFPSDLFTPLIVLEPMPCTEAEYRQLHEAYRQLRDQRDAAIGGEFGRLQVMAGKAQMIRNEEVDAAAERLTPYRSWWKHLLLIADLLDKLKPRRAIFLVEPRQEEVSPINAIPMAAIGDDRIAMLPESMEQTYLLSASVAGSSTSNRYVYHSLAELAEIAWRLCGPGTAFPAHAVEVPEKATAHYLSGLCRALRTRLPLRPVDRPASSSLETECAAANAPLVAPTEAVLIETSDAATCLLGVQYAQQRGAKLILSPPLDPSPVNAARAAMENCQQQAAKSLAYVAVHREKGLALAELTEMERAHLKGLATLTSDPAESPFDQAKFIGALRHAWNFLFDDEAHVAIRGIEHAVSTLVPDDVVSAVGNLDLTVFSSGLPYNFLKKNGVNWSSKPIGHILGDPSLLILTELCLPEPKNGVAFNLLFDPGYFQTTETQDVLNELSQRVSYSLVLHDHASSHQALGHLGGTLPLEVVFFNTHGDDQVLVLSDMAMPAYKIVQRTQLPSRPIVFNNSCLSWVGVGREFIRIGARAYVGTLWSVDARMAAQYARTVLMRMIRENQPVCQAMRTTDVDPRTERAYLFIGTCRARLAATPPDSSDQQRQRMITAAEKLLESALVLFQHTNTTSDLVFHTVIEDLLIEEAEKIGTNIDQRWPGLSLERLDLHLMYLQSLVHLARRRPHDVLEKYSAIDQVSRQIEALSLDPKMRAERHSQWLDLSGCLASRLGQTEIAIHRLTESVEEAEKAGLSAGPQYLELSDAYKKMGKLPEALAAAKNARDTFTADPGGSSLDRAHMLAVGRLASISNWLGQFEAAAAYAREGFQLASRLSDPGEQSEFKADETRALMGLKDFDRIQQTAKEAVYFARLAHDNSRELSGMGLIARALILKADTAAALEIVGQGLELARARGQGAHVAEFLRDLADIATQEGLPDRAYRALLQAVPLFVIAGAQAKAGNTLDRAAELRDKLGTWSALTDMLTVEIDIIDHVEFTFRRTITMDCVLQLKSAISRTGVTAAREPLQSLARATAETVAKRQGQLSDQMRFIADAVHMFAGWAQGEKAAALQTAGRLDQLSAGHFGLVAYFNASMPL